MRFPQELRLHRALDEFDWINESEFNAAAHQRSQ
jgi:hypothetical protein